MKINNSFYGPSFGYSDLILFSHFVISKSFYGDGDCYSIKSSYEKPIRKTEDDFTVEEYEVFQIVQDIQNNLTVIGFLNYSSFLCCFYLKFMFFIQQINSSVKLKNYSKDGLKRYSKTT